jgi:hypothetical protein
VFFSFNAGGYFAGAPAVIAVLLGLLLLLRITLAESPFEGFTRAWAVAAAALGGFAVWTLMSAFWSDAPARAMIEFDRALAYWLALVLFASFPRDRARIDWALRGMALAILIVCGAAFVTRALPDLWTVAPVPGDTRLSYPLTYWNALALMASLGLVMCLHLTSSERESRVVRPLAAAVMPVLGATLLLTLSRGAILVAVIASLVYLLVARPRGLPAVLLGVIPPLAVAVVAAYRVDELTGQEPAGRAAVEEGGDLALVVGLCMVVALVLRAALMPLDARLRRVEVGPRTRRRVALGGAGACLLAVVVAGFAFDVPSRAADQYESFKDDGTVGNLDESRRSRLTDVSNNGRLDQWEVALEGFRGAPIAGEGAGGFQERWERDRPDDLKVEDAHSLYLETLSEFGIVGLLLLLGALGALLGSFLVRARGEDRHVYAALFAAGCGWALHAGIDWDWEMPAVTFWLFALGGLALAGASTRADRGEGRAPFVPSGFARVGLGVAVLALIATPALMALSQARLNEAVRAFKRGDCTATIDAALASTQAVSVRPEPFQLLAYCDARLGQTDLAIRLMQNAVRLEPGNWESHYGLALVTAAAGQDPRPAVRRALELNPLDPLARAAGRRLGRTDDPQEWKRRAASARLPII